MLFDLLIALRLHHDLSRVAAHTPRSGDGYTWVPTDQAHGRTRQVGPAYQKTSRPDSGPNQPSWRPTRPPEYLSEDSLGGLIQNNFKTCMHNKTSVDSDQADQRIWQVL
jgi:hypothetical protein